MALDVLVLEDDAFTRLSIVAALRAAGVTVCVESGIPGEAVLAAHSALPNVALLDLHLGDGPTGVDVARSLRRIIPSIGIVLLTSFDEPRLLDVSLPSLPAGAQYVTKKSVSDVNILIDALNRSRRATAVRTEGIEPSRLSDLTNVQIEVLRLVAEGLSNQEIAKRRFTSEKSVEATVARIAKAVGLEKGSTSNQRVGLAKLFFEARGMSTHDKA